MSVEALSLIAPAKVNLVLEVQGRRPDGYHDLDTVLTTIDLVDRVRLRSHPTLDVQIEGRFASAVASDGELAAEAARALAGAAGRDPAVAIELTKSIPVAAGLGGGSSDAAAVLRGLDRLWGLGWAVERLEQVAASVGSDVPFFLHGGTARCHGRGELVEPLRDLRPLRLLLLLPPLLPQSDKTARRFSALHAHDFSGGERSRRVAHRLDRGAPMPAADLWNAFEAVIERTESELLAHYAAYGAAVGGGRVHLSGTGPAVFLLVHDRARIAEMRRDLAGSGVEVFAVRTLPRAEALAVEVGPAGAPA